MERIKLSKDEKKVLMLLHKHGQRGLDTMPRSCVRRSLRRLESLDMVKVAWIEGGDYEVMSLTRNGKDYLIENPKLLNPIDWKWITATAIGIATCAGTILSLVIACSKL